MWGQLAQATNQAIFGTIDIFQKRKALKKMIASQEKMNAENIAAQERINQANIDYQNRVNDIMRHDANNAIAIKKRDLQNAGYSTADPSMSGHQIANLGSPNLQAAVVQPEYTAEMAQIEGSMFAGLADRLLATHQAISSIELQKAQARAQNASATGQEIDNDWKEAMNAVRYDEILQNIQLLKSKKKLTDHEADNAAKQMEVIQGTVDNLVEDAFAKKTNNATLAERNKRQLDILDKTLTEMQARIDNLNQDTSNKKKEGVILDYEKRIKAVEADFAELGINFNGGSIVDALLRIIASPRGAELATMAINYIRNAFKGIISGTPIGNDATMKGIVDKTPAGVPTDGN